MVKQLESALTTIDNPYDPFTQYDEWLAYDEQYHHTAALLDRVSKICPLMSDEDEYNELLRAQDSIVEHHVPRIYKIVYKQKDNHVEQTN